MALQKIGNGLWYPQIPFQVASAFSMGSTTALTGSTHKGAYGGRFFHKDGVSKTVVGVGLLFGTIVKAGGSGLTITQQGMASASGPPGQPDGTVAQTWSVANGDTGFASSTWLNTADNAGVSVGIGDAISIVVEYDGSGRLGSDSVILRGISSAASGNIGLGGMTYYNGTTWAAVSLVPSLVLKCSDGTYGTLEGAIPCTNLTTQTFNSGSSPAEYGLEFTVPAACKVDGLWGLIQAAATTADRDLILYDAATAVATASTKGFQVPANSAARFSPTPIAPQSLATGTTYRVGIKATGAGNTILYYIDLNNALHRQALPGWMGADGAWNSRTGGTWGTSTTTRVPLAGVRISHIDDGAGGGGSVPIGGGSLNGGLQ